MGESTKIQWTDHTFNPWWGCQRVSPGCEHCYAETFSKRVGLAVWGPLQERRHFGEKHWREPLKWDAQAKAAGARRRVFCASMADVFEDRRDLDADRDRLFRLIEQTPNLDWLLLTKRPENMVRLASWPSAWPTNVWAGTTAEDQERADARIPRLLAVPAAIRFVSYEPAIGPVDFTRIDPDDGDSVDALRPDSMWWERGLDWIIVGGESGPGARPFDLQWARNVVAQCEAANVACFVKQMGADPIDGEAGCSVVFRDRRKGGDITEWPRELCVREWPGVQ